MQTARLAHSTERGHDEVPAEVPETKLGSDSLPAKETCKLEEDGMSEVTYEIVEHDGGWAYKANGVFSETFPSHAVALKAATMAAAEQIVPGRTEVIQYEDAHGKWHVETARGTDRPATEVKD